MSDDIIRVKFVLGIGLVGCRQEKIVELNRTDYTKEDGSIDEDMIDNYLKDWAWEHINLHAKIIKDGENDDSDD